MQKAARWFLDKTGGAAIGAVMTALIQWGVLKQLDDFLNSHPVLTPVLIAGIVALVLVVVAFAMSQRKPKHIKVHYAGWGRGMDEADLYTVTDTLQTWIDAGRTDIKASTDFFSERYVSPRVLKVEYSFGLDGERHKRIFKEHELVRLD